MTSTLLLWHFWGSSFFQIKLPQFKLATPFPSSSSASSLSPGEPHSCSSDFLAGEALKQVLMLSLEHRGRQTDGKMIIYEQCRVISRHISVWRISNLIERASGRRREWDERLREMLQISGRQKVKEWIVMYSEVHVWNTKHSHDMYAQ